MRLSEPNAVRDYLLHAGIAGPDEVVDVEALSGGVSSDIFLVRRPAPPDWVVKQALPNLRVDVDWPSHPRRIYTEAAAMRWLATVLDAGAVPAAVHEDRRHHVLAMEAVPEPHTNWKSMLLEGDVRAEQVAEFTGILARIHLAGSREIDELAPDFGDRSFFESLRLEPYYEYTATKVPVAADFLRSLCARTRAVRLTMTHGDFSPKNVLVRDGRLVLLDHEVAHIGDPAFDIGFSMAHLLAKSHHVRDRREHFRTAAHDHWRRYLEEVGNDRWDDGFGSRAAAHVVGCTLARACGRSPLEYLAAEARDRQRRAAESVIAADPADVHDVIDAFVAETAA